MGVWHTRSGRLIRCDVLPSGIRHGGRGYRQASLAVGGGSGRIEGLADKARKIAESTDCFVGATSALSGMMLEYGQYLPVRQFMMDLYLNQRFAHRLVGRIAVIITKWYLYYLGPIAPYIGWIEFSSDHGMQDRPLVSRSPSIESSSRGRMRECSET